MNAIFKSLAIVVGIPTLMAALYFGAIASDIYVSEARFAIRSSQAEGAGGLADLLASPVIASGGKESMIVVDYVHSQDMLQKVERLMDLRTHYSNPSVDRLARLDTDASREEFGDYFRHQVNLVLDSQSDVVTLRVRAFDPETAKRLAELVIELSETLVNEMSYRMEVDALATARDEMVRAVEKVRSATENLTRFRKTNASLNPAAESSALLGLVSGIESSLISSRTELSEKLAYMKESSPAIVSLKNRINALSRQLRLERGRMVGTSEDRQMTDLIEGYEPLVLEQELAQQQYASALTSLEIARIEAQRKKQYLVTFIRPGLPEEAVEPRRITKVLTVAIFSFLTYLVGGLMWAALKDHIGR